jgi:hypothetical protein
MRPSLGGRVFFYIVIPLCTTDAISERDEVELTYLTNN